jgi:aspartate dehydrogenase
MSTSSKILCATVVGLGAIGTPVARALAVGIPGFKLVALASRDAIKARACAVQIAPGVAVLPADALPDRADVIVDCAPSAAFPQIARRAIEAGRILVTVNAAALLENFELVERARVLGARIIVPTGALLGFDAVRAAAEGTITRATIRTRKHPRGLEGAPYLIQRGETLAGLNTARCIFKGSARDGAKGFPANVNVAAALSLAGIGPDATELEIWADPAAERNEHTIEIEADSARFTMKIEGVPSPENPRTGKLTPLSVLACLRGMTTHLKIGS